MDFRPLILPVFSLAVLGASALPVSAMHEEASGESEKARASTSRDHAQTEKLQVSRTKLVSIVETLPDNPTSQAILEKFSTLIKSANPTVRESLEAEGFHSQEQRNRALRTAYQKLSGRQQLDIARALVEEYPHQLSGAKKERIDNNSQALVHVGPSSAALTEDSSEVAVLSGRLSQSLALNPANSFQSAQPSPVPLFRPSSARPGASSSTSSISSARSANINPSEEARGMVSRIGSMRPETTVTLLEVAQSMGYRPSLLETNIINRNTAFKAGERNISIVQENIMQFLGHRSGYHDFVTRAKEALILPELVERLRDSEIRKLSGSMALQMYAALYAALEAVGEGAQLSLRIPVADIHRYATEESKQINPGELSSRINRQVDHLKLTFGKLTIEKQYTFAEVYRNALNDAARQMVPAFLSEWALRQAGAAPSTSSQRTAFAMEMDMDEEIVVASTSSTIPALSDRLQEEAERRGTQLTRQRHPHSRS